MPPIDPLRLTVAEAALLLSKASGKAVTEEQVREAIEDGCPVGAEGHLNLVHVAAWLNHELHKPTGTIASAMLREWKSLGSKSRFHKTGERGKFAANPDVA